MVYRIVLKKNFDRTIICIQEEEKVYKVISIRADKKDGSIYIFFNYCKEKGAFIMRHKKPQTKGPSKKIDKSLVTHEFVVDGNAKLSIHKDGFVQLSGKGITSGIDPVTGKARGVGVFSSPLDMPVRSGPTFGFECWGIEQGFELLKEKKRGIQYIILSKSKQDFTHRYINAKRSLNTYVLEFFIFPKEANKYIYENPNGNMYINHIISNYYHDPGALFAHPVIDLSFFDGVLCVFPCLMWTQFAEDINVGYIIGGPGGADSKYDKIKAGYYFQLFCPKKIGTSLLGDEKVMMLERSSQQ